MGDVVLFAWFVMFLWALCSIHKDIKEAVEEEENYDGKSEHHEEKEIQ